MRIRLYVLLSLLAVALAGLCGCANQTECGSCSVSWLPDKSYVPSATQFVAGRSIEGRNIDCIVMGRGTDTTMFIASIHGTERAGTPIVQSLIDYLNEPANSHLLTNHRVVIMPIANPDGYARKTRYNVNGVDLNRNFPADNRENNKINGYAPLTEPESWVIFNLIDEYKPAKIVAYHEAMDCIDYDGPGEALARHMASKCQIPFQKVGARPGSLGSYAGEFKKIPIITVELPKDAKTLTQEQLWERYGQMSVAAITF